MERVTGVEPATFSLGSCYFSKQINSLTCSWHIFGTTRAKNFPRKSFRRALVCAFPIFHQVSIDVECNLYVRMPHRPLNRLRVSTNRDQLAGVVMTESIRRIARQFDFLSSALALFRLYQPGLAHEGQPRAPIEIGQQLRPACLRRKYEINI